jgi:hypothetical protein
LGANMKARKRKMGEYMKENKDSGKKGKNEL